MHGADIFSSKPMSLVIYSGQFIGGAVKFRGFNLINLLFIFDMKEILEHLALRALLVLVLNQTICFITSGFLHSLGFLQRFSLRAFA